MTSSTWLRLGPLDSSIASMVLFRQGCISERSTSSFWNIWDRRLRWGRISESKCAVATQLLHFINLKRSWPVGLSFSDVSWSRLKSMEKRKRTTAFIAFSWDNQCNYLLVSSWYAMHSIFAEYCGGWTYVQHRSDRNLKDLLELLEISYYVWSKPQLEPGHGWYNQLIKSKGYDFEIELQHLTTFQSS